METTLPAASTSSLHPVLWIAGISVTLLSLAGVASLTGLLPERTAPAGERPAIVASVPANTSAPVAAAAPVAATPVAPAAGDKAVAVTPVLPTVPAKAVAASQRKAAKAKTEEGTSANPTPHPVAGGVPPDYVPSPVAASAPPPCVDCGVIANVREVTHEGPATGAGAVIGGLAGAVLGSNIGRGNTRTLASIAGAVGGGMLGNSIEKSRSRTTGYEVSVRMEDGGTRTIAADALPSWRIGDKVRLANGAIVSR
ncbi:MAG: glycine zipper 2TM domain-containing protein [Sulfuritalea sp.]|nr:glycine zipper 2TM domain-containing protein [Sulfuritalea sp.]